MKELKQILSLGAWVLCLSLASVVCHADPSSRQTEHDPESSGSYSAAVLYNLGNIYAREGKPALAVLCYERARMLAPRDPDIRANLQHERDSVSLPAVPNRFESDFRLLSPNSAYWLGLSGLIIAGISGLLLAFRQSPRIVSRATLGGGLLLLAYALGDATMTARFMHEAVVMQSAAASASPIAKAEPLFTLSPGAMVYIQEEHGNFLLVRDAQSNVGWVPRSEIARVIA